MTFRTLFTWHDLSPRLVEITAWPTRIVPTNGLVLYRRFSPCILLLSASLRRPCHAFRYFSFASTKLSQSRLDVYEKEARKSEKMLLDDGTDAESLCGKHYSCEIVELTDIPAGLRSRVDSFVEFSSDLSSADFGNVGGQCLEKMEQFYRVSQEFRIFANRQCLVETPSPISTYP